MRSVAAKSRAMVKKAEGRTPRRDAPIEANILAKVAAPHHRGATPGMPPLAQTTTAP
jgi:hypothetical protein